MGKAKAHPVDPAVLLQQITLIDAVEDGYRELWRSLRRSLRPGRRPKVSADFRHSVASARETAARLEGAANLLSVIHRDLEEHGECVLRRGKERR